MSTPDRPAPEECANCGAAIPRGAKACPECGADERTGWRDSDVYDGLELPDEAWSDERTSGKPARRRRDRDVNGIAWYWWCVAAALLLSLVLWMLGLS